MQNATTNSLERTDLHKIQQLYLKPNQSIVRYLTLLAQSVNIRFFPYLDATRQMFGVTSFIKLNIWSHSEADTAEYEINLKSVFWLFRGGGAEKSK